jgi:hypothetical protein
MAVLFMTCLFHFVVLTFSYGIPEKSTKKTKKISQFNVVYNNCLDLLCSKVDIQLFLLPNVILYVSGDKHGYLNAYAYIRSINFPQVTRVSCDSVECFICVCFQ